MQFLDLGSIHKPLHAEIMAALESVVTSGSFILGPFVKKFEEAVASYLGVKHAVGVNSGTDALILALRAHGIGPGDEVVVPSWTFFATSESVAQVGAVPVFVDINPQSYTMDIAAVEAALSPKTKAIIPVHLYGQACDMDGLMALSEAHGLALIEDTAQAFGGSWQGRKLGSLATGAFSFFPSKNLGGLGDGGLVTTNDDGLAETVRSLRAHGSLKKYRNEILGYNSRLDALQAAVLSVKLPHIDSWNEGRRVVARAYNNRFAGSSVRAPMLTDGHVFHQYTVRVPASKRDQAVAKLKEDDIPTMVYYPIPNHKLPVFETVTHIRSGDLAETNRAADEVISLPIWPGMEESQIDQIAQALLAAVQ